MSELFDRARNAWTVERIAEKAGVKLRRQGNELRGSCPICQASARSGTVFKIDVDRQTWFCFACERRGDVVDLHAALARMSLGDAARELAGPGAPTAAVESKPREPFKDDQRQTRIRIMAGEMWSHAKPLLGSVGQDYLIARKIAPAIVDQLVGPRFHEAAPHSWDEHSRTWRTAPAIVLRIETPGGWPGGVHVTYLRPDGLAKSLLTPSKRMWGPQGEETEAHRRRGGAWLSERDSSRDLVVGEGMETTLSLASHMLTKYGVETRQAAALSLGALQGTPRRDDEGCVDIFRPVLSADATPFTWPPCYTADERRARVLIGIDRDMSPVRMRARSGRGRPLEYDLDADARARLCSMLASQAWLAAGWDKATPMYPPAGGDWNDQLPAGGIVAYDDGDVA